MSVDFISVRVQNNSGKTLYIALHRADGPWLGGINGTTQTWTSTFDQSNCVREIASGNPFSFDFPEYNAAGCRMYISVEKLTGVPNLTTAQFTYDKVEMGWNATWNQTSVDFFAIPLQLSVNGGSPVGFKDSVTRSSIFTALAATPAPYNTFMYPTNSKPEIYRYFSPAMASSLTKPPWNYNLQDCLGQAIRKGLPLLAQYSETFNYGGFNMSNFRAVGTDGLTVTCNNETITLSGINSATAFSNAIKPEPSDDAGLKVAGIIGCALNRGVLYDPTKWGENGGTNQGYPEDYYVKSELQNASQFNYYAQVLHDNSLDGKCYGQSYDDFFNQAAAISVNGGDSVTIKILPFV